MTNKDLLTIEYGKVYSEPKMLDYCVNRAAEVAVLPHGEIIVVEKQKIVTSFCFGESGYDMDDAIKSCANARTNRDYFKRQNMAHYNDWIREIVRSMNHSGNNILTLVREYRESARLFRLESVRLVDVIDACGGECNLNDLSGKTITWRGVPHRIATKEECEIILDAYRRAAITHEKKVDGYLKRYGTSKVRAWTYWRDA